ncbi:protein phosphatase 1 regulatory subunit 14B isoform X1 [Lates calcarifer]|uniref:Protein phosphatase 1 regulatory subunit 14B isoform X1 n=1 Tax=Lates calcarifer TaxID=8187 RepID=A0A4W6EM10_LATCA|nr:protein phosphatase 1 regulatory subunit 14B isoform X1 [Lates calcarifer]XP_050927595.1 protein phosphatase 1 regulatory subunit 14B isoform X1 [Lates calcarifer]
MADQTSSQQPRVMFRTPEEEEEEQRPPHRPLGRLTTKYDRRDLQRRLDIEQWMETQLQLLFDCQQEDQVPELQIDVDELQELSDSEQRSRLNVRKLLISHESKLLRVECQRVTADLCFTEAAAGLWQTH